MGGIVGEREGVPEVFLQSGGHAWFYPRPARRNSWFLRWAIQWLRRRRRLAFPERTGTCRHSSFYRHDHRPNQQMARPLLVKEKKILKDGVGRSAVPFCTNSLLWRDRNDEFSQFGIEHIPSGANVPIQRMGFVLDKDGDFSQAGVQGNCSTSHR